MGMTGHSAVFLDSKISADAWREIESADDTAQESYQNTSTRTKFCTNILAWVPCQATSQLALDHFFAITYCVTPSHSTIRHFHREFWAHYEEDLEEPKKPDAMARVAEELCNNTAKVMTTPKTNVEWLNSFCGSQSRWEGLGVLFVIWGIASLLPDTHPLLLSLVPADMTKHSFALSMLECADACLIVCEELDPPGNLLYLILFYHCVRLQSCVRGDTSKF